MPRNNFSVGHDQSESAIEVHHDFSFTFDNSDKWTNGKYEAFVIIRFTLIEGIYACTLFLNI